MRTIELIKYLTISFSILPSFGYGLSVKDMIKSSLCSTSSYQTYAVDGHQHEMTASATYYALTDNRDDGQEVVVIDAGHGGHDPGTHGKRSNEKDIALKIALELGKQMKESNPEVHVIYTRDTDVFIALHERIGLANDKKADLFISIHCNYVGNPQICGTETYVMGLHRAEDNLNVAKRENSVVLLESEYETHYEGYDPNSPVGHILLSMIQNVFIDHSIDLASKVESQFITRKKTKSRGVKQAGFVVLRQATMPSILVETGFLSNAKEEAYLISENGQKEIASGIRSGIIEYLVGNRPSKQGATATTASPRTDAADNPDTDEVTEADPPSRLSSDNNYVIQVGVYSTEKDEKYAQGLRNFGTLIIERDGSTYKYVVGYFVNKADAKAVALELEAEGYGTGYIRHK